MTVKFLSLVKKEYDRVSSKLKPFNSFHEAYGKLCEEVAEFFEEVRAKSKKDPANTLMELVQISVVCQRAAESLLQNEIDKQLYPNKQMAEWDGNNNTF